MSDPFEKAKAIREGELDDQLPDYEEITGWFQRVPITWLPGLFIQLIGVVVARKVFKPGKVSEMAAKAEEIHSKGPMR